MTGSQSLSSIQKVTKTSNYLFIYENTKRKAKTCIREKYYLFLQANYNIKCLETSQHQRVMDIITCWSFHYATYL